MREKIAEMPQLDRSTAERLHEIVTGAAPELRPKLSYGQPGWARADKVVVFFRSGLVDKTRCSTLGFSVHARLDDAAGWWPTSYALRELTDDNAAAVVGLVTKALG